MGLISMVIIDHDSTHAIEGDSRFGKKLSDAVIIGANSGGRDRRSVSASGIRAAYGGAAKYVATFGTSGPRALVIVEGGEADELPFDERLYLLRALDRFRKKKAKNSSDKPRMAHG